MKKKEYFAWEWPGFYWYQGMAPMRAWFYDFAKYGCEVNTIALTFSKGTEAYYFDRGEYTNAGLEFFKKVRANPKIIFKVLREIDTAADSILALEKKWKGVNFKKLDNKELLKYHAMLFKHDEILWRRGQIPNILELSNSYLSDWVKKIIVKKYGHKKLNSIFTVVTTSRYNSKTEQQGKDFLELILKFKKIKPKSYLALKKHWKKYTWMTYGWAGPALPEKYFAESFVTALKSESAIKDFQRKFSEKQNILKQQTKLVKTFSETDQVFLNMLRMVLESKAKRVDAHSFTYFNAEQIMSEIGKRVGLSMNQMRVVVPQDVPKLFKKVDVHKINEQNNRILITFNRPHMHVYTGKTAEKRLSSIIKFLPRVKKVNELKGEFAYPGKVLGRVRIILDIRDADSFQKGEILVTRMTDPNYMPIMKLSKAVVTDIGGITSHAAILARELKKPCVIGTKIATQVFKDGDMVEVDAHKGTVRKLY